MTVEGVNQQTGSCDTSHRNVRHTLTHLYLAPFDCLHLSLHRLDLVEDDLHVLMESAELWENTDREGGEREERREGGEERGRREGGEREEREERERGKMFTSGLYHRTYH